MIGLRVFALVPEIVSISRTSNNKKIIATAFSLAPHSSTLAWRIPGTGEPGGLLSMGSHRVRHD